MFKTCGLEPSTDKNEPFIRKKQVIYLRSNDNEIDL